MSIGRRILYAVAVITALYGGVEFCRGWAYARPTFDWKEVVTDSYVTEFPAHWDREDPDKHPRLGRRHMAFENRPLDPQDDSYHRRLGIEDRGVTTEPVDTRIAEMRQHGEDHSAISDLRLTNGVVAKTWTHVFSTTEIGIPVRWYVFKGTNGHLYTATHDVPPDWMNVWRYDRLFRRILGSMKFKDAPAPALRKGR